MKAPPEKAFNNCSVQPMSFSRAMTKPFSRPGAGAAGYGSK